MFKLAKVIDLVYMTYIYTKLSFFPQITVGRVIPEAESYECAPNEHKIHELLKILVFLRYGLEQ